uniref:YbfB/YjiJ family MFS transporter n=1 Tax=Burkholderia sp. IMCC1007 TaxID=3004104 RepID=UPI0022B4B575
MRAAPQPEHAGHARPDAGAKDPERMAAWRLAICLSLGSAIALGLARFSYALLLPPMKADLGWSFAQAGALNTANAAGYLIGALAFPFLSRRWRTGALLAAGCVLTAMLMAACGITAGTNALLIERLATGIGSALIFISGGLLAARLASASPRDAGLLLGLYYGGTGWGIVASSLLVPATLVHGVHGWQPAWFALAVACVLFSMLAVSAARRIERVHAAPAAPRDGTAPVASAS